FRALGPVTRLPAGSRAPRVALTAGPRPGSLVMRAGPPRYVALAVPPVLALVPVASAQSFQPRMGEPLRGLSPAEHQLFEAGRVAFDLGITPAAGRGPIFNDESCGTCHSHPTFGGSSTRTVTRFGRRAN